MHRTLALLALLAPGVAFAQSTSTTTTGDTTGDPAAAAGFDAHGFNLVAFDADPRDALQVQRPGSFQQGDWFAGGVLEYAKAPLVFVSTDVNGEAQDTTAALDNVFALNVSAGVAALDMLRLDVAAPLYFTSTNLNGDSQGVGLGDLRFSAMLALAQPDEDEGGFGFGVIPYIDAPIGSDGEFLGQSGVTGGGKVAATYELSKVTVGGDIGLQFEPGLTLQNLSGSDSLNTGLALGVLPTDTLGVTLETRIKTPFQPVDTDAFGTADGTQAPIEMLLSMRKTTESGGHVLLGGAAGLSRGASAAAFRVFLGGGFGHLSPRGPFDLDGDGFTDDVDTCPSEPETVNSYKDDDGCPDAMAKVRVAVVSPDGKPVAGAQVTLTDGAGSDKEFVAGPMAFEAAAMPGSNWTAKANMGPCLVGEASGTAQEGQMADLTVTLKPNFNGQVRFEVSDDKGQPINDVKVTWKESSDPCVPAESFEVDGVGVEALGAGSYEARVKAENFATVTEPVVVKDGQVTVVKITMKPTRVRLEAKQIVILDKVYFEVNKAIIKPESFALLDEVATTINTNPQIKLIEVGGHTDSDGSDSANLDLSQRRAEAVRVYLMNRGVAGDHLTSKGYGETVPIASNKTSAGKAENRRVEFVIVQQDSTIETTTPQP